MSFGAIGVEIMAKIKIMRVVIGFTKKEKRKRGNNHVKKKLVQVTAAAMAATMLFSVPAMAKKNFFSFNVKTSKLMTEKLFQLVILKMMRKDKLTL